MAFSRSVKCGCCNDECTCSCPDCDIDKVIGRGIVTIEGFSAGSPYECGICDLLNGEFQLAPGVSPLATLPAIRSDCFFSPKLEIDDDNLVCFGEYFTGLSGGWGNQEFYCGDYEPLLSVAQKIVGRSYCAYEKDGKIYRPETAPTGAKLIGRALEIRMMVGGTPTGVYDPGNYCYSVTLAEAQYATSFDLCYANISQYGLDISCCDAPADFYNTMGPCFQDCGYYGDPSPSGCGDPSCYLVYGFWAWRTIIPVGRKCEGLDETLRLITDEEELSREFLFGNHRFRANLGASQCTTYDLCTVPLTIKLEI